MAHDEVGSLAASPPNRQKLNFLPLQLFSGPMAESLPTSVSAFSHRRPRADSTTSFAYYQDEDDLEPSPTFDEERRSMSDVGDFVFGEDDESNLDIESGDAGDDDYMAHRRRSSTHSRSSVHARLLRRDSATTSKSLGGDGRISQKVYMVNEDLTIVIAGFRTSRLGFVAYGLLCVCTLGLSWLLLRWFPRWQVRLLGRPSPLAECDWVVVEVSRPRSLMGSISNSTRTNGVSSLLWTWIRNSTGDQCQQFSALARRAL